MVWNANNETATDARDTVVIGDTSFDMEMARNAGAFAIGVTYGNHAEDRLRQAGAHLLIHSFTELPAALRELSHEDYRA
jgi:phosphoglycolate phosphatase